MVLRKVNVFKYLINTPPPPTLPPIIPHYLYFFVFLNIRNTPADFFSFPPMLDLLPVLWVSFSLELSLFALFTDERESKVADIGRDDDVAGSVLLEVSKRALPQP